MTRHFWSDFDDRPADRRPLHDQRVGVADVRQQLAGQARVQPHQFMVQPRGPQFGFLQLVLGSPKSVITILNGGHTMRLPCRLQVIMCSGQTRHWAPQLLQAERRRFARMLCRHNNKPASLMLLTNWKP